MSLNSILLKTFLLSVLAFNERSWDLGLRLLPLVPLQKLFSCYVMLRNVTMDRNFFSLKTSISVVARGRTFLEFVDLVRSEGRTITLQLTLQSHPHHVVAVAGRTVDRRRTVASTAPSAGVAI